MIKISLKGLAKFMTASPAGQRKVLRDFKYPDPEGNAQAIYYRESRDFITAYHANSHSEQWLVERANDLANLARLATGRTVTRLEHNARAIRQYAGFFGNKVFGVLDEIEMELRYESVRITVNPELHVCERGREKIIKLEFSAQEPEAKIVKIISQTMFEAASNKGLNLPSSGVLYFDTPRGQIYNGARAGSRMCREIQAACENIAALWDNI